VILPSREILMGMAIGAVCGLAVAAIGPGIVVDVVADELPPGFDTDNLVKIDDRLYTMDYEPWVATDPLSTATVKKIEGGEVSYVQVTTTNTGTYSTDGLTSRHVQYPGIEVEEVWPRRAGFFYWSGRNWTHFSTYTGNSYVSVHTNKRRNTSFTCVATSNVYVC
jgi:hypothetical protein